MALNDIPGLDIFIGYLDGPKDTLKCPKGMSLAECLRRQRLPGRPTRPSTPPPPPTYSNPLEDFVSSKRPFVRTGSGTKYPNPGGPVGSDAFEDALKRPFVPSGGATKYPSTPISSVEPSAGGGGAPPSNTSPVDNATVFQNLLRGGKKFVRGAGRVAGVVGPFVDLYGYFDTYLNTVSDYERFRRRQALPRSTGPKRRASPPRGIGNTDLGVDVRLDRRRGPVDLPVASNPVKNSPISDPFSRPFPTPSGSQNVRPGRRNPVATRRDTSRPGVQPLLTPGGLSNPATYTQTLFQNFPKKIPDSTTRSSLVDQPQPDTQLRRLTGPGSPGSTPSAPSPGSPTSAPGGPATSTKSRCASDDPCMQRAAAKRREQRAKQKKCPNPVTATRQVRTCPPSSDKLP